jgi:hypothetical protein
VIDAEIERMLGPTVAGLLRDPHVQDILANHDTDIDAGIVFVDYGTGPRCATGTRIRSSAIKAVTRLLATVHGQSLDPFAPSLTCDLACGARYHGVLSPGTDGPSFSIRTHQRIIRPLSDFASPEQAQFIEDGSAGRCRPCAVKLANQFVIYDRDKRIGSIPADLHSFSCNLVTAPYFKQRTPRGGLCGQFVQERLGVFEIGGVETFGEPVVDLGEYRARLITAIL